MMLTLVDRHDYHQALTELPRVAGGTRAAAGRGADGCARVTRDPPGIPTEAIPAVDRDAEAVGRKNAMTVIFGSTRDKRQHRKESS
jgi:hypothetical protein